MSNDLFGNNGIKCISHTFTFFYKNVLPYFAGTIGVVISLMLFIGNYYLPAIIFSMFSFVIIFAIVNAFRMRIADAVYIDYEKREFIFQYDKGEERIRKNFKDMIAIEKMAMGETIKLVFEGNEERFFYASQGSSSSIFPNDSVYKEIKFIMESNLGEFLTDPEI